MKIAILGAGNIGLYVGGRLSEAGADVTFVGRSRMADYIKSHGLKLNSYLGDSFVVPKRCFDYVSEVPDLA